MAKKYCIVDFEPDSDEEVQSCVVPSLWLNKEERMCFWPTQRMSDSAIIRCIPPEATWQQCRYTQIKYESDDYIKAQEKLRLLLSGCTDVESMSECSLGKGKRHLTKRKRYESEEEDEDMIESFTLPVQSKPRRCDSSSEEESTMPHFATPKAKFIAPQSLQLLDVPSQGNKVRSPNTLSTPTRESFKDFRENIPRGSGSTSHSDLRGNIPRVCVTTGLSDFRENIRRGSGLSGYSERLHERILYTLEKIVETQKEHSFALAGLSTQARESAEVGMPAGISLPLDSEENLTILEDALLDRGQRKKVVQYLATIGGSSVLDMVRRILRKIFATDLAIKFNFTGVKGKRGFNKLQLRGVLLAAVRGVFKLATETEVDCITQRWFISARDRDGGRQKRMQNSPSC